MSTRVATAETVRQAFLTAGATPAEATEATQMSNRIQRLKTYKGRAATTKQAIENQYSIIREQVFGPAAGRAAFGRLPLDKAGLARANQIMVSALQELGAGHQLKKLGATALDRLSLDLDSMAYEATVKKVLGMADWQSNERKLAKEAGLDISTITWEDMSRTPNSAWGDNITDMNVAVEVANAKSGESKTYEMPVIRRNNFEDVSADVDITRFMINVGNAKGGELRQISLKDALERPWELMNDPKQWPLRAADGSKQGVFAPGTDDDVLVSSQATFLPVTQNGGRAVYKPHVYNYQSHHDEQHGPQPSVLTLMVTREGTSMAIMGREKDRGGFGFGGGGYGEPLYFNENGNRAPLTAERASESRVAGANAQPAGGGAVQGNADQANRVLIIQIPLTPEHPRPQRPIFLASFGLESVSRGGSDLENAVVGHGPIEGPFDESMGKGWKRDAAKPVRVTVQLTKATSNGVVTKKQMEEIKRELDDVYQNASRVGSLVVNADAPPPFNPGPNPGPLPPFPVPVIPE